MRLLGSALSESLIAAHIVVSDKVTLVATDEHAGYRNLRKHGLPRQQVNYSEKQYVVGSVHTNTIENFWSLLKRGSSATIITSGRE